MSTICVLCTTLRNISGQWLIVLDHETSISYPGHLLVQESPLCVKQSWRPPCRNLPQLHWTYQVRLLVMQSITSLLSVPSMLTAKAQERLCLWLWTPTSQQHTLEKVPHDHYSPVNKGIKRWRREEAMGQIHKQFCRKWKVQMPVRASISSSPMWMERGEALKKYTEEEGLLSHEWSCMYPIYGLYHHPYCLISVLWTDHMMTSWVCNFLTLGFLLWSIIPYCLPNSGSSISPFDFLIPHRWRFWCKWLNDLFPAAPMTDLDAAFMNINAMENSALWWKGCFGDIQVSKTYTTLAYI